MCASYIREWSHFVRQQFVQYIDSAFATGACVVVLGFDNYEHVPESKNMTQAKRCKQHVRIEFDDSCDLPPHMPQDWQACMRNRAFKTKVMHMIINTLRVHYNATDHLQAKGRSLVLDFVQPEVLGAKLALPTHNTHLHQRRGECDIKAFHWSCYGPLLIFSTDGDYLMIALMQLERHQHAAEQTKNYLAQPGMDTHLRIKSNSKACAEQTYLQSSDRGAEYIPQSEQQYYLWRMTTRVDNTSKRKASDKPLNKYEYVNIQPILQWLQQEMIKIGCVGLASDNLAALVAATGCDFCMSLPQIGPIKLWQNRFRYQHLNLTSPLDLMRALTSVYVTTYGSKMPGTLCRINASMTNSSSVTTNADKKEAFYPRYFQAMQAQGSAATSTSAESNEFHRKFEQVSEAYTLMVQAMSSNANISDRIKDKIWSTNRMLNHVLNSIWTTRYWMFLDQYPDPLRGFGYRKVGTRVQFQGLV